MFGMPCLFACSGCSHNLLSPFSESSLGSGSDQFEDWPKANDTAASVYIASTMDVLSFRTSMVTMPRGDQESRVDSSCTRQSRSQATSSQRPHRWKPAVAGALQRKSKRMMINAERVPVAPLSCGGSLSATDFEKSKWKIMYPLFVKEGLVDPSEHNCFVSVM